MKTNYKLIFKLCLIGIFSSVSAQEVKINSNLVVESDGTLRMDADAMVYDDLRITLDKGSNAAALEYFSGSSGPQIWYFRNNEGNEVMSFTVQLPHSWKEGTAIYPHLHWSPRATKTGNVEWIFEYTWANYDSETPEVFPAISTSTVIATGPFTANTHRITSLTDGSGLDATGKLISSILICRIWRNSSRSNDTYSDDAGLLFLDFHYQLDTFGSREQYVK